MTYNYIVPDYIKEYVEFLGYNMEEYHIKWRPKEIGGYIDLIKKEADKPVEITCKLELTPTPHTDKRLNVTNTQESKMVKVGDRVKLVKRDGAWCDDNVGKEGTVTAFDGGKYVNVLFDNSERHRFENDWGNISHLEIISTTPTYTIPADTETVTLKYADGSTQDIDVKDRARGVPEWVKDGQWVVSKDSGKAYKLVKGERTWYVHDEKENTFKTYVWDIDIVHHYRPFTISDWKWGMWAEYRGEKVFVMSQTNHIGGVTVSTPTGVDMFYCSELTPATAP